MKLSLPKDSSSHNSRTAHLSVGAQLIFKLLLAKRNICRENGNEERKKNSETLTFLWEV